MKDKKKGTWKKKKVKKELASLLWTMKHVVVVFFCYRIKLKKKNEME